MIGFPKFTKTNGVKHICKNNMFALPKFTKSNGDICMFYLAKNNTRTCLIFLSS